MGSQFTEVALQDCQFHCGQVVDGQLIEACGQRPALLQPVDATLDHVAASVRLFIEVWSSGLILARGDHGPNPAAAQITPHAGVAIAANRQYIVYVLPTAHR